jgi:WhiB family redox-sensing transcriptional regulator
MPISEFVSLFNQPEWSRDAACREHPELHWVSPKPSARAKAICQGCLVKDECLDYAVADKTLTGVWGGTDERERRTLRQDQRSQPRPSRQPKYRLRRSPPGDPGG